MNSLYFVELKLNNGFVDNLKKILKESKNKLCQDSINRTLSPIKDFINNSLSFIILEKLNINNYEIYIEKIDPIFYKKEGYFTNKSESDYTLLIGLNESKYYEGGNTILWFPLDNQELIDDYNTLIKTTDLYQLYDIFKKYNISYFNKNNLLEKRQKIVDKNIIMMPKFFKTLTSGNALLFKSSVAHSGEEFYSFGDNKLDPGSNKELLMISIKLNKKDENIVEENKLEVQEKLCENNIVDIYPNLEKWMINSMNKTIIPFQVLICSGEYNDKTFEDIYTLYINEYETFNNNIMIEVDSILEEIYETTKKKLNTKYREYFIKSEKIEENTIINDQIIEELKLLGTLENIKITEIDKQIIDNYIRNFEKRIKEKDEIKIIVHIEEIINTWDEKEGPVKEYDETTFLKCKLNIKYGFYKI